MACIAIFACMLTQPAPARAGDANDAPPRVEIRTIGGGLFGPDLREPDGSIRTELVTFLTAEPGPGWRYANGSSVAFTCLVDGDPVECDVSQNTCCERFRAGSGSARPRSAMASCARRSASTPRRRGSCPPEFTDDAFLPDKDGFGPFIGRVLSSDPLKPGRHRVTVIATDDDGTQTPSPSASIYLDLKPPKAPNLLRKPPRVSTNRKPVFRFTSTDDFAFPSGRYSTPNWFGASLRRLRPTARTWKLYGLRGSYLERLGARCTSRRRCAVGARPVYPVRSSGGYFGAPELLSTGLYRLDVVAYDRAGNESRTSRYRFRVRAKPGD